MAPKNELSDHLIGLWAAEQDLGPLVRGELIVDARRQEWRARVAGYDIPVERQANDVSFRLPAEAGEFRAHITADAKSIMGHWIQPANLVYNSRYASPVVLLKTETRYLARGDHSSK